MCDPSASALADEPGEVPGFAVPASREVQLSKWSKNPRLVRVVLILGAIASFAAAAGAGTRWG
jgi:hypothetical protein